MDLCEVEKFKVCGGFVLFEVMWDGILNFVNEVCGKKDGMKGVDKLNEVGFVLFYKVV